MAPKTGSWVVVWDFLQVPLPYTVVLFRQPLPCQAPFDPSLHGRRLQTRAKFLHTTPLRLLLLFFFFFFNGASWEHADTWNAAPDDAQSAGGTIGFECNGVQMRRARCLRRVLEYTRLHVSQTCTLSLFHLWLRMKTLHFLDIRVAHFFAWQIQRQHCWWIFQQHHCNKNVQVVDVDCRFFHRFWLSVGGWCLFHQKWVHSYSSREEMRHHPQ